MKLISEVISIIKRLINIFSSLLNVANEVATVAVEQSAEFKRQSLEEIAKKKTQAEREAISAKNSNDIIEINRYQFKNTTLLELAKKKTRAEREAENGLKIKREEASIKKSKSFIKNNDLVPRKLVPRAKRSQENSNTIIGFKSIHTPSNEIQGNIRITDNAENMLNSLNIKHMYHMTHIDNLANILKLGILPHDNSIVTTKIDNPTVNNRRSTADPINGKPIHTYVPLYFNPKNAMLFSRKNIEDNILILAVDRFLICHNSSIFTDGNAASDSTKYYNNIEHLRCLDWSCINGEYWGDYIDGKRKKMAEILIREKVESSSILKIFCKNYYVMKEIQKTVINTRHNAHIEINDSFYFEEKPF